MCSIYSLSHLFGGVFGSLSNAMFIVLFSQELQKLRRKITSTVQMLTHLKEKLQFVQVENQLEKSKLQEIEERAAKVSSCMMLEHDLTCCVIYTQEEVICLIWLYMPIQCRHVHITRAWLIQSHEHQ